jgi:hypothetical protein
MQIHVVWSTQRPYGLDDAWVELEEVVDLYMAETKGSEQLLEDW